MRNRLTILSVAALLPLTAAVSLAAAGPAGADPKSGTVVLTGSVDDCAEGGSPNLVTVKAGQETRKDSGTDVGDSGTYTVTFKHVPKKAEKATALVSCEDGKGYTQSFTLSRPPNAGDTTQTTDLSPE